MRFAKMHGAGNDFALFNGFETSLPDYSRLAVAVCDRHYGTGGDGIMVALPSTKADVRMAYVNSDGTPGEICGNGIRCFARYVYDEGIVPKRLMNIETLAGIKQVSLDVQEKGVTGIRVMMGKAQFESSSVPVICSGTPAIVQVNTTAGPFDVIALRMGVPHGVVFVETLDSVDVDTAGRVIETYPTFPEKINANFVEIINRGSIRIKTFERAAGHTLACGTGCCASVAAGYRLGKLDATVKALTEGGTLQIQINHDGEIYLCGSAEWICTGEYSKWVLDQIDHLQM